MDIISPAHAQHAWTDAAQVYQRYAPSLCTLIATIICDEGVAEDLCHDVFTELLARGGLTSISERALERIARRKAAHYIREHARTPTVPFGAMRWSIVERVVDRQTQSMLDSWTALAALPAATRQVLMLLCAGYDIAEIATQTQTQPIVIQKLIARGRRQLRAQVLGYCL